MDLSEPSTSLELTPYKRSSKCKVCKKPAHGFHHGALTCRACCAFFRRSAGSLHDWDCMKDGKCEINEKQFSCKKCRIVKCFEIGMTADNFQFDRDTLSSLDSFTKKTVPMSLEKFLGRPHIIIRCEPKTSKSKRVFLDLTRLVERGSDILSKTHKTPGGISSLEKLTIHMNEIKKANVHGNKVYQKVDKKVSLMFWEFDFCRAAEWLSHFDEFQELPMSLKMEFLKSTWYLWTMLERITLTCKKHSEGNWPISHIAIDDTTSINAEKMVYDLSWCTDYEPDKIHYFTDVFEEVSRLKGIADVLLDLKPTDVEVNFMILQICFRYAGRRHQGEILNISEKLLGNVSNQMHDYYSKVMKMPNYAGRLARLMKCDRFIQEFILNRKQKIEIAQTFDIFNLQYSHPEVFAFNMY